jgi:uncharacterized protein (TIGR00304 family)
MDLAVFYALGVGLIVVGVVVVVLAVILVSTRSAEKGKAKMRSAGVIIIGPIPIIFGTDKKSVKEVLTLALAVTLALIIAMILYYLFLR